MIFITHFFEPEIGAASQRISALANRMVEDGENLLILTTVPSHRIVKKIKFFEKKSNIRIVRFPIFQNSSNSKFLRLLSMVNFGFYIILMIPFLIFLNHKRIFVQGHPLISSFISIFIFKKLLFKKIILNVSDLWPKSGLELEVFQKNIFYSLLKKLERFNYINSDLIITQSEESKIYINKIVNNKKIFVFYNVPRSNFKKKEFFNTQKIIIIYGGLLGHAQNILATCKNLEFTSSKLEFHIYGEGSQKKEIRNYIESNNKEYIFLNNFISPKELDKKLQKSDIGLVQLKKRIHGALPSKLFHYLNLNLPVIFIGEGEASEIIEKNNFGWSFKNNNYKNINNVLKKIIANKNELNSVIDRINTDFKVKYNYENQYERLKKNLFL